MINPNHAYQLGEAYRARKQEQAERTRLLKAVRTERAPWAARLRTAGGDWLIALGHKVKGTGHLAAPFQVGSRLGQAGGKLYEIG